MLGNFTAADVVGTVEASLLLTLILFIPGYVVGWLSDAFAFRERRFALQLVLSTPLAVATSPIVVYLLGPYPKVLWTLFAASWFAFFFIITENFAAMVETPVNPRAKAHMDRRGVRACLGCLSDRLPG